VAASDLLEELGGHNYPQLTRKVEAVAGGLTALAEELGLDDEDLDRVRALDGRQTLRDLGTVGGSLSDLPALVAALEVLGFVELIGEPVASVPDLDPVAVDRARIQERLELARDSDYFAILGLPRNATRLEVRRAYDELTHTFSDESLELRTRRELEPELAALRLVLQEARDILGDDALRSAYLAHLEDA
jgi:hypothetical protein